MNNESHMAQRAISKATEPIHSCSAAVCALLSFWNILLYCCIRLYIYTANERHALYTVLAARSGR